MHAQLRVDGQAIMAMDSAEAEASFNEAVSLIVNCEDQAEVDRLWAALSAVPAAEACGWLKDRFGVSWQIDPRSLGEMLASGDTPAKERMFAAVWSMKKLDLAAIERAFAGTETVR
jgi:predicted 3-demethylubiquinone-9 3-methyltransferase (glyoxalase superfamily)